MIHVDRSRVPKPSTLQSPAVHKEMARAREFFSMPERERRQRRYEFRMELYKADDVMKTLAELFHGKCAYCESKLAVSTLVELDHFRPKHRAMALDGKVSPDHYWWLAYEWENLYPACAYCNRSKAARFPVKGRRVEPFGDLGAEELLLLDPCRDEPAEHLLFSEQGLAVGQSERGKFTVDAFNLNREELVKERQLRFGQLASELVLLKLGKKTFSTEDLARFVGPAAPYSLACAHAYARWAQWAATAARERQPDTPELTEFVGKAKVSIESEQVLVETYQRERIEQNAYSVEAPATEQQRTHYYSGAKHIEQVMLHNFKGITHLELRFPPPCGDQESWVMLLGENGTGKSSILQGVALTLMGERQSNSLSLDASRFVKNDSTESEAWVEVRLSGLDRPVRMRARRDSPNFTVEPKEPKVLLMGYGATRLLPHPGQAVPFTHYIRVQNLFDPTAPLTDAETWLTDPSTLDDTQFDQVATALKDLLLLRDEDHFVRESGAVYANVLGARLTLRQLSDGLQSVLALAADIIITTHEYWPSMQDAEGIVLLDEIEVHLHPSWKLQIVNRLRRTFPRLNFLVTTHDPLCLRGLQEGEIVLLRRDREDQVEGVTNVPSVDHLRADQILTSFLFSLPSTRSGDSAAMVSRYSRLLGEENRSPKEEAELRELESALRDMLLTGETPLQRKVEQAVKKAFLELAAEESKQPLVKPQLAPDVEFEIRRQLAELLGPRERVK